MEYYKIQIIPLELRIYLVEWILEMIGKKKKKSRENGEGKKFIKVFGWVNLWEKNW